MLEDQLRSIVEEALVSRGFNLVLIRISGRERPRVHMMIERFDMTPTTIENCEEVSRVSSMLLDVADPMTGAYTLEVSSTGLDRPLVSLDDYRRFNGYIIQLETHALLEGRKRFKGRIEAVEGETITLEIDEDEKKVLNVDWSGVRRAKLDLDYVLSLIKGPEEKKLRKDKA